MVIDWVSDTSEILMNPRLPDQNVIYNMLKEFSHVKGHVWVSTSGSTAIKWVALSKEAILASAKAVNEHLQATAEDIWINPLPDFHVAGLGIFARGYLSRANVIQTNISNWDVKAFYNLLVNEKGTLSALVPTQIHDIVRSNLPAPKNVRAIIVGGGRLDETLYHQAVALGWPLLPSYGLTECCSQVATAPLHSVLERKYPNLRVLSHLKVDVNSDGFIRIKGKSLLTGYVMHSRFFDPKKDGWFLTEDLGKIEDRHLQVFGRQGDFIKIGGESVDVGRLQSILDAERGKSTHDIALIAIPDVRLGHVLHVVSTGSVQDIVDAFNKKVLPFERIRKVHLVTEIPRTPLKKLCKTLLMEKLKLAFSRE